MLATVALKIAIWGSEFDDFTVYQTSKYRGMIQGPGITDVYKARTFGVLVFIPLPQELFTTRRFSGSAKVDPMGNADPDLPLDPLPFTPLLSPPVPTVSLLSPESESWSEPL